MTYEVQTDVFEGPFDLLLHLILREQVDVYEVSLATIVDAYLQELGTFEHLDLETATEFLLIAATLVELKARRLLPGDDGIELDDELALWSERDLLLARLLECKTFKDAASVLASMAATAGRATARRVGLDERYLELAPDLLANVTPDLLRSAYLRATAPKPAPRVDLYHVAPARITVIEAVAELADELPRVGKIGFRALTSSFVERLEVVVRFLAVLELYKQGLVELDQPTTFGDIQIRWVGPDHQLADDAPWHADLALVDSYDG